MDLKIISGTIAKATTHQKVIKLRIIQNDEKSGVTCHGGYDVMMFRTDLSSHIRRFMNDIMSQAKKQFGVINKSDVERIRLLTRQAPLFLTGTQITVYCSRFKDALTVKQMLIKAPHTTDKMNCKKWISSFGKWCTDFSRKQASKSVEDRLSDMNSISQTRQYLSNVNFEAGNTVLDAINKNDYHKLCQNSVFWVLHQLMERFNLYKMIRDGIEAKANDANKLQFTEDEMMMVAEYCDNYEEFVRDPYVHYTNNRNHSNSFITLDKFAALHDVDMTKRVVNNAMHVLSEEMTSNGHTCCLEKHVTKVLKQSLSQRLVSDEQKHDFETIDIHNMLSNNEVFHVQSDWVYLKHVWHMESYVAQRIVELQDAYSEASSDVPNIDPQILTLICQFEEHTKSTLNDKQKDVVQKYLSMHRGLYLLTGLPGTGKSLVIACLKYIADVLQKTILLCAPTGKAAKRLGKDGQTIHRALETMFDDLTGRFTFVKNESNLFDYTYIVIDEASMMDLPMFYSLLQACSKDVAILIVGDPHQLPSVGYGDILKSLLEMNNIPCTSLSKVYRQENGSMISMLAKHIVKGIVPSLHVLNDGVETFYIRARGSCVIDEAKKLYKIYRNDAVIISPMRKGSVGTVSLNKAIHCDIYPDTTGFHENERILIVSNAYKKDDDGKIDVLKTAYNGDIGYFIDNVQVQDNDEPCYRVWIDDCGSGTDKRGSGKEVILERGNLDYGHACTVHKMQGAEVPIVILIMSSFHESMLNKQLFYTAVTRAKSKLYIIGDDAAIVKAISTPTPTRHGCLAQCVNNII